MKLAILADLHANREAVEAVLDDAAARGAQGHVLLGDFVGYGADPAWVVDRVRALVDAGAIAVQGNHDRATVHGALPSMHEEPRQVIGWTRAQLDAGQIDFLERLPLVHETAQAMYVHANAWQPAAWHYVLDREDAVRSLQAARRRLLFCGHVHEPRLYHLSRVGRSGDFVPTPGEPVPLLPQRQWLVIAGSTGQPRDGDPAACWAMHDTETQIVTWHRVPYDHEAAAAKIRAAGLPDWLAERLLHGR